MAVRALTAVRADPDRPAPLPGRLPGPLLGVGPAPGPVLPAVASTAVQATLAGPVRNALVLGAFRFAVYLLLDAPAGNGPAARSSTGEPPVPELVALVSSDGAALPQALVLACAPAGVALADVAPGGRARVGAGLVRLPGLAARPVCWWNPVPAPRRPPLPALAGRVVELAASLPAGRCGLPSESPADPLVAALVRDDLAAATVSARALVGLGPGLTPSGDDYLCALLATLLLLGGEPERELGRGLAAAVVADAATRTTALAASLLWHAGHGRCSAELGSLLRAVAGAGPVQPAVHRLLRFGHSSGADTVAGVTGGLAVLARRR